jgi:hypothetical protein
MRNNYDKSSKHVLLIESKKPVEFSKKFININSNKSNKNISMSN